MQGLKASILLELQVHRGAVDEPAHCGALRRQLVPNNRVEYDKSQSVRAPDVFFS